MISSIGFYLVNFLDKFVKQDNLPTVIQGLGIALITILIPFTIAILSDIYQKRRQGKNDYVDLDLHVILDKVFKIKYVILSVFLIFTPLFFWSLLDRYLKFFAFIGVILGIYLLIKTIFDIYKWIKGNVFGYRFSYLKKMKSYEDLEIIWKSIWQVKNINYQNEKEFINIFYQKIDNLFDSLKKNYEIISILLSDFYNYINDRSIYLFHELESNISLNKILEWHFQAWQNKVMQMKRYLDGRIYSERFMTGHFEKIAKLMDKILFRITERSLIELRENLFCSLYFKEHMEKYKNEFIRWNFIHYYIDHIFYTLYGAFFKNILLVNISHKSIFFWGDFPKKWKITKANLTDEENKNVLEPLWKFYQEWFRGNITQITRSKYFIAYRVSSYFFPEVNPNLWMQLLIFVFLSSKAKTRIKQTIQKYLNFNLIERERLYSIEADVKKIKKIDLEAKEIEKEKTYELAYYLFNEPKYFSKQDIEKYIKEIKNLGYAEESNNEKNRLYLLNIFNEMLDYINRINYS